MRSGAIDATGVAMIGEFFVGKDKEIGAEFHVKAHDIVLLDTPKNKEFYDKTIRNAYDCESLSLIIKNFAFCDKSFSYMIAEVVVRGINEFEFDANEAFYYILEIFFFYVDPP